LTDIVYFLRDSNLNFYILFGHVSLFKGLIYSVVTTLNVVVRILSVAGLLKNKCKGHPATGRGCPRCSGYVKAPDFLDVRHYEGFR
jgi:hypothetical protein